MTSINLEGRVALVTGAGPNIGRAIATTLGAAGAFVYCNDVNHELAEKSAAALRELGAQGEALAFDVADPRAVETAIASAHKRRGPIDILVNNAAITIPKGILDVTKEEWQRVVNINVSGAFYCCQAVARHLVAAGKGGAIVNIGSTSAHRGRQNAVAYCSAKGSILNMTRAIAIDLAPYKIRVNSVSPTKTGVSVGALEAEGARSFDEIPLGRLGRPTDQANAVLFLVSDMAEFITGEDIRVDGGTLATWSVKTAFDSHQRARKA